MFGYKYNILSATMSYVRLALPVSHHDLLIEHAASKEAIFSIHDWPSETVVYQVLTICTRSLLYHSSRRRRAAGSAVFLTIFTYHTESAVSLDNDNKDLLGPQFWATHQFRQHFLSSINCI